jgi:surfeit locus 1 family protein
VALHLGTHRFAPPLFATVLVIIGVALGVRLGMWQLARADEKRVLLEQFAAGANTVRPLSALNEPDLPRYQSITAQGRYDSAHQVLLDNMPAASGKAGFRVLTPFELEQDTWILVDRGWLAMGATRNDLPDIAVSEDERSIAGRLDELPRPGMRLSGSAVGTDQWPRVLNFPQHADLEQTLGRKLARRIVLLDPQASDGFERVWTQRTGFGPERHIAYAVQWFALAATMLIVYLVLNLKRRPTNDTEST